LYINIGISNWHNWSFVPKNMNFFTLCHFLHETEIHNEIWHINIYMNIGILQLV